MQRMIMRHLKRLFTFFIYSFLPFILSACHSSLGGVLNPKGVIAYQERQLLFDTSALMLIVVIPVIIMSFAFVVRYRASQRHREYRPNWSHSAFLEAIWWGVPCVIIFILGVMTWRATHHLDPYHRINKTGDPLLIQTVALPWKWLFIYPAQHIAVVNELVIPKNREVKFVLSSDNVPMSAFFIPQLGSQIYAMAGMVTQLHLVANHRGTFLGLNTQYNGDGFSEMHFKTRVVSETDFTQWVRTVQGKKQALNTVAYARLLHPQIGAPVRYYHPVAPKLFRKIVHSYMSPDKGTRPALGHHEQ